MRLPPRRNSQAINTAAADAMTVNNQRCQPSAPARKLNAAPVLNASTRLANGVSASCSPGWKLARIAAFVNWSAMMTTTLTTSQRHQPAEGAPVMTRSRKGSRFACAEEVRTAAAAQRRMRGVGADIRAVMPAALALRLGAWRDGNLELIAVVKRRGRRNHHEAQIVAEACERRVVVDGRRDRELRLQRGAHLPSMRKRSISFSAAARTARMRAHFADSSIEFPSVGSASTHTRQKIDASSG